MRRPRVLFVCVENSCRSQMAEGFARFLGGDRVEVHSAGSRPSGSVHPMAVSMMAEKGIALDPSASKGLDALPPVEWDFVVTMGCGDVCPSLSSRNRRDWALPDPKNMSPEEFRRVRDNIEDRVRDLLQESLSEEKGQK